MVYLGADGMVEDEVRTLLLSGVTFLIVGAPVALADEDPNRDVVCVSDQIGVTEDQFRTCFLPVQPDADHDPDGATQQANKAKLLPCLLEANPRLTNAALDVAMDSCRPEGPIQH